MNDGETLENDDLSKLLRYIKSINQRIKFQKEKFSEKSKIFDFDYDIQNFELIPILKFFR
ncbi:MAG: hypothetical protein LBH98_10505 [Chitinispirillales bacterium]|jgi:hypothetical protein|nr:hypothetical protein [Chitinispirillales bacterium]